MIHLVYYLYGLIYYNRVFFVHQHIQIRTAPMQYISQPIYLQLIILPLCTD